MSERKFRDVTEDDIGKRIEVTDDRPTVEGIVWYNRTLRRYRTGLQYPFQTNTGSVWRYARIEVTE